MGALDLKFYLSIFVRRLHYFIVIAALVSAIGVTIAVVLPPVYKSTASILVESEQIPDDLAASTVGVGATEQIQIIQQRMMTRTNLLDLARRKEIFDRRPDITASAIVNDMRERTEFKQLNFGKGGATAFTITFAARTPRLAADVTNELVALVLQENVRIRTGRATDTLQFFEQEVERLSGELDRISSSILEFKAANQDALPDSLDFRRTEQARTQERLLQLEREETGLRDARTRLIELFERTGSLGETDENLTPEERELKGLQQTLEQQLILFSESNPKIVLLKQRIGALQKVVDDQRAARGAQEGDQVVTELDLRLEQIDGRIEYIDAEQERLNSELEDLTASILATPGNELRQSALERELSNTQNQYNAAIARLATAETGERIELLSKGERFSIIEQATPIPLPDSPNRPLIAIASIAMGLASGLGVVVLLEILNRSIRRPVDLTNRLGIQAFGTVPYMRTRRERIAKRAVIGSTLMVFTVAVPLGIWALHTYYLPLDLLIRRGIEKLGVAPYLELLI